MHLEPSLNTLQDLPLTAQRLWVLLSKSTSSKEGEQIVMQIQGSPAITWVVNPSLDDIIQRKSTGSLFIPQLLVQVQGQHLGHVIVVMAQVGVLLLSTELRLQEVVAV